MKTIQLGNTKKTVSSVILGCMRLAGAQDPQRIIETAFDQEITFFDHAIFMAEEVVKRSLGKY